MRRHGTKGVSWRWFMSVNPEVTLGTAINKPLAYGTTTDVIDHFICQWGKAVRQENHHGCSTIHVSGVSKIASNFLNEWNDSNRSVLQCEVMRFCALSSALVKSVPP
jgi:hypothetical protein